MESIDLISDLGHGPARAAQVNIACHEQDFENTLDAWMEEFHKLLIYQNAGLTSAKGSDRPSAVDGVKAAVCQNINLLVNRDEEEFSKFLQIIVQDVWSQLMTVTSAANQVSPPPDRSNTPILPLSIFITVQQSCGWKGSKLSSEQRALTAKLKQRQVLAVSQLAKQ